MHEGVAVVDVVLRIGAGVVVVAHRYARGGPGFLG
jgi:hypothetical protein